MRSKNNKYVIRIVIKSGLCLFSRLKNMERFRAFVRSMAYLRKIYNPCTPLTWYSLSAFSLIFSTFASFSFFLSLSQTHTHTLNGLVYCTGLLTSSTCHNVYASVVYVCWKYNSCGLSSCPFRSFRFSFSSSFLRCAQRKLWQFVETQKVKHKSSLSSHSTICFWNEFNWMRFDEQQTFDGILLTADSLFSVSPDCHRQQSIVIVNDLWSFIVQCNPIESHFIVASEPKILAPLIDFSRITIFDLDERWARPISSLFEGHKIMSNKRYGSEYGHWNSDSPTQTLTSTRSCEQQRSSRSSHSICN